MSNAVSTIRKPSQNIIEIGTIVNINSDEPKKNSEMFKAQIVIAFADESNIVDGLNYINGFEIGDKSKNTLSKIKAAFSAYYNSTGTNGFLNPDYEYGIKKTGWGKDEDTRNKLIGLMSKYGILRRIERDEDGRLGFDVLIDNIIEEIKARNVLFYNQEEKTFEEFNKEYLKIIFNDKKIPDYLELIEDDKNSATDEDEKQKFSALLHFLSAVEGNTLVSVLPRSTLAMWRKIYYTLENYAYWDRKLEKFNNGYILNMEIPKKDKTFYKSIGQILAQMLKENEVERKYGDTKEVIKTLVHPYNVTFGSLLGGKVDKKTYNFAEFLIPLNNKEDLEVQGIGKAYAALFAKQVALNNYVALYNIYNIKDLRMQGALENADKNSTEKPIVKLMPADLSYANFTKYDIKSLSVYEYENLTDEQKLSVIFHLSAVKGAKIVLMAKKPEEMLPSVAGLFPKFNAYGYTPKISFMPFVDKLTYYTESNTSFFSQSALEDALDNFDFGEASEEDQLTLTQELSTSEVFEQTVPESINPHVPDADVEEATKTGMTKKTLPKKK